jgi:predicted ATPase with chaperone activity
MKDHTGEPIMSVMDLPPAESSLVSALGLDDSFRPPEVQTLEETGLSDSLIESLAGKYLLGVGSESGRRIADALCLPFGVVESIFQSLRTRRILSHTGSAPLNDYVYALSDEGREWARNEMRSCAYVGPAPVPLAEYVVSVQAQTIRAESPKRPTLEKAFSDIHVVPRMFENLGPAINAGKGMFIYGPPGNGKTTLAKRITAAFGQTILIPHTIVEDGQLIKFFDASCHEPVDAGEQGILKVAEFDRRWIRIRRPTVIVGGELTMDSLELTFDPVSNVSGASLQMRSNCGCLLIDDFGRQRVEPDELLNRWIVPLENRIDFLTLSTGKKLQVPFDQLIIFSTNLEPQDLADDAFLRRIPYKIEVGDPEVDEFHTLFEHVAKSKDCEYRSDTVDNLIQRHYQGKNRPLRRCHPRDLMDHIESYCRYNELPFEMSDEYFNRAVEVYFTAVSGK